MIQRRRVHSLNWFHKNCELNNTGGSLAIDYYDFPGGNSHFILNFRLENNYMQRFCGKVVNWDPDEPYYLEGITWEYRWQEWMFEPGEVNE